MCLCFSMATKAQITKIDTYKNRITSLTKEEKEKMDFLFFGAANRIKINDIVTTSTNNGPARVLELNYSDISKLQDKAYSNIFQKIRVISIDWGKGKPLDLKEEDLKECLVLKYILIKGLDDLTKEELVNLFKQLSLSDELSDEIEIIYYKMNAAS